VPDNFAERTKVEQNAGRKCAVYSLRGEGLLLLELVGGGRGRCCIWSVCLCASSKSLAHLTAEHVDMCLFEKGALRRVVLMER
jgi:hypothetical protein